jgi:hypothetical protein
VKPSFGHVDRLPGRIDPDVCTARLARFGCPQDEADQLLAACRHDSRGIRHHERRRNLGRRYRCILIPGRQLRTTSAVPAMPSRQQRAGRGNVPGVKHTHIHSGHSQNPLIPGVLSAPACVAGR